MNESAALLQRMLDDPPLVHRPGSEITRKTRREESQLSSKAFERLVTPQKSYSVDPGVLWFLLDHAQGKTLETGCGLSTLVFAMAGAEHVAVTPHAPEEPRLRDYAQQVGLDLSRVTFVLETSETYLPRCDLHDLDAVLLDGKHAFPWPMVDFFYTADRIQRGGLLLIDDVNMRSVAVLRDFLDSEAPRWEPMEVIGRTAIYRKLTDSALDVAWHMQPWTVAGYEKPPPSLRARVRRRLRTWGQSHAKHARQDR